LVNESLTTTRRTPAKFFCTPVSRKGSGIHDSRASTTMVNRRPAYFIHTRKWTTRYKRWK